jgi:colanic acid/amylovoran biosynthesis glycosyltransferase
MPATIGEAAIRLQRMQALRGAKRPDIVHCHYGEVGLGYRFLGRFWSAPLVVSFYGYDCSSLPRAMGDGLYRPLFRLADSVIVLSEAMRERLLSLGCPPALLHVHPLGVDTSRFAFRKRNSPGEVVRILTVGRLVEKKGIEFALRAVAQVVPDYTKLRYDIIGDGPLRDSLERLSRALQLEHVVRFLGPVEEAGVAEAMDRADLFVLPSITAADGDEEGTPTVLIEASSCGLPIVSTRHAGIPEVVVDGISGFLVPERDVPALAERIRLLLERPERWAALGRAGRRHVESHFDTRVLSRRMEAHYAALSAKRARGVGGGV